MFGVPNHQLVVAVLVGIASGLYIFKPFVDMKKRIQSESVTRQQTAILRDEQDATSKNEL